MKNTKGRKLLSIDQHKSFIQIQENDNAIINISCKR